MNYAYNMIIKEHGFDPKILWKKKTDVHPIFLLVGNASIGEWTIICNLEKIANIVGVSLEDEEGGTYLVVPRGGNILVKNIY